MIIYILLILMLIITIFIYKFCNQGIVTPSIGFILPFSISILWLTFNIKRWSVELTWNTFSVIIIGTISLLIGVSIASIFNSRSTKKEIIKYESISIQKITVFFITIFESISLLLCLLAILHVAAKYGYTGSISNRIYGYRCLGIYTTNNISLGRITDWLYIFNVSSGYIWLYLIINSITTKSKINKLLIVNLIISIITALIKGGRQSTVQMLFSGIAMYIIMSTQNQKKEKLSLKTIILLILILSIFIFTFQQIGVLLGRTVKADFFQYLSVYLSGGINNLNNYLKIEHIRPEIFGKMTFIHLIRFFGNRFHKPEWVYPLDLPYQSANGLNTGNIYTTFYAYIYDFGYKGIIILPFIIGFITQKFYLKSKKNLNIININTIIYSYMYYTLVFSFFSNKFFEGVFTITFLKYVFIWILLSFILKRIKIKLKK